MRGNRNKQTGGTQTVRRRVGDRLRRVLGGVLTAALLLGILTLTGCSSSSHDKAASTASGAAASMPAAPAAAADAKSEAAAKGAVVADKNAAMNNQAAKESDSAKQLAGSPVPTGPAAGITPPMAADSSEGFNRKLIYKANLVMEVADYGDAQTKLRNLAALSGAFILQFTETTNDRERSGNYTIKVAAQGFASFLDGLERISPSLQRSVQGQDVTEEYVDLGARLKAKQAVETRLLAFMEKAQKTDDLVAFSNELAKVQTEIEQIKGRVRYLDQNVALSTIELRLYQKLDGTAGVKKTGDPTFLERLEKATAGSWKVLAEIVQGIVIVLAAVLPVIILCGIGIVIYLIARKRRERKLQQVRTELRRDNPIAAPPQEHSDTDQSN